MPTPLPLTAALLASLLLPTAATAAPLAPGEYSGSLTTATLATGGALPEVPFAVTGTAPFTVASAAPVSWSVANPVYAGAVPLGPLPYGTTGTLSPHFGTPLAAALDPGTGTATTIVRGHIDLSVDYDAVTTTCHLGSVASPITVRLSTSKPGGSAYAPAGGGITLAD